MNDIVHLEALSLQHTQALYQLTDTNREYLREWLPWLDNINNISDTQKVISTNITPNSAPIFILRYHDKACGVIGFNELNTLHKTGVIGYWLDQAHTGKGIVTNALKKIMVMAFNEHKLHKIDIRCAEDNLKSRAIPERLGFTYEATLRDCEWLYTKHVNHAVYSMLASEYRVLNLP